MTNEQVSELIGALRSRHELRIEQLSKLFESAEGSGVFELASQVLGDPISAADWLTKSHLGLNGGVPAVVALEPDGHEAVETYLQQIEYGVYV